MLHRRDRIGVRICVRLCVPVCVLVCLPSAHAQGAPAELVAESLTPIAARVERHVVDAAGMARSGRNLVSLEPTAPPRAAQRRLVIIGGLDGRLESRDAVLAFLREWAASANAKLRQRWQVAAIPCALPDLCDRGVEPPDRRLPTDVAPTEDAAPPVLAFPPDGGFFDAKTSPETRYAWRWTAMETPDLVIDARAGAAVAWQANALATVIVKGGTVAAASSFAGALGTGTPSGLPPVPALQVTGPAPGVASAIVTVMQSAQAGRMSPLRRAADARAARPPIAVASILAPRYPEQPIMSYIPGLAWSGALRLSQMTGDKKWRDKPRREMEPFITGAKPSIAEPYQLTSLAGHLALFDLAAIDDNPAARAVAIKAADFILPQRDGEIIRFPRQWTDDMFMATSILARAGAATGDAKYGAAAGRLLTQYAALLQRPDGIFIHAQDGPHAWGRGNGFAAFGLMEALAHLPRDWSDRAAVLAIFQKHMRGMRDRQAADGMWREVVDAPGSYREVTVTAQTLVAMARGVRLGWLDASFRGAVDRAWRALRLRVADDGTLVDVCTGTGAGPTLQYYLDRGAIFGADDRGGAMALQAALEMATPASR